MSEPLIIIQARTSSRRLPAKVLSSFRGYPLAILATLRAATHGGKVVMATSTDFTDDALAATAAEYGITCVRGPLNDVLSRFCLALGNVPDETPVIRLTADNVVPDGGLIADILTDMQGAEVDYISLGAGSGLPYGVSVEATFAGHLRAANQNAQTAYEREHVTPWLKQNLKSLICTRYKACGLDSYRLTVDTLDDLVSLHQVFPRDCDPVSIPWREIVDRVDVATNRPGPNIVSDDLVLGTAQLGMSYGINRVSTPTVLESQALVRAAISAGVSWIDTARAYGNSEAVLGSLMGTGWDSRCRLVTKLDPLLNWSEDDAPKGVKAAAESSLLKSLHTLQVQNLDTVLLHRATHWSDWGGVISDVLTQWQDDGRLKVIGVSVQSPVELAAALQEPRIGHVQMPFNILDHRWERVIPQLRAIRAKRELTVHLRSALLQGLLLSDDSAKWQRAHIAEARNIRNWLSDTAQEMKQSSISELCLNWCRSQNWADGVVVGMDTLFQLQANLKTFAGPKLLSSQMAKQLRSRPILSSKTLDPAQWTKET